MSLWVTPDVEVVMAEAARAYATQQRIDQMTRHQAAGARDVSRRLTEWGSTAPWLSPGLALALTEAGIGANTPQGHAIAQTDLIQGAGLSRMYPTPTTGARPLELPSRSSRGFVSDAFNAAYSAEQQRRAANPLLELDPERPDSDIQAEWDTVVNDPDTFSKMREIATQESWHHDDFTNLVTFARNNGISVDTVMKQAGRWYFDNGTGSVREFVEEAVKDRPSLWQQTGGKVTGFLSDGWNKLSGAGRDWGGAIDMASGGGMDLSRLPVRGGSGSGGIVGPAPAERVAQEMTAPAGNALVEGVKSGSRFGLTSLDAPRQLTQALFRNVVSGELNLAQSPNEAFEAAATAAYTETDLGIMATRHHQGEDYDLGQGWFPNVWDTDSDIGSQRHAAELRHGDIGGHTITAGRWLANRVFEPDTLPFDVVSGLADAFVAVANPGDLAFDAGIDAMRGARAVTNWRSVDHVATDPRFTEMSDVLARATRGTNAEGVGVHRALEQALALPAETRAAMREGRRFNAPGMFADMSPADRQVIARYADELEETFPTVTTPGMWISAVDESLDEDALLSGGGIRARLDAAAAEGVDPPPMGTFTQASLDEGAAIRWDARHGLGAGDVPDLPAYQLTLDEYTISVRRATDDTDVFVPGLVDSDEAVVAAHRREVASAIARDDIVPATVLLDHTDMVPAERLREIVSVDMGLIEQAWRPDVVVDRFDVWLGTRHATRTLDAIAGRGDTYDIWRLFNRRIPVNLAAQLADLTDPELISEVLRRHLGVEIRSLPSKRRLSGAPRLAVTDAAQDALSRGATPLTFGGRARLAASRLLDAMPVSSLDIEDLDGSVVTIERWMRNAGMDDARIRSVIDRVARINPNNPEQLFDIAQHELADVLRDTLLDMGVHRERANSLARMYADQVAGDRQWMTNDAGASFDNIRGFIDGEAVRAPGPMLASELVQRHIPLPSDARDIRLALSPFSGLLSSAPVKGVHDATAWFQQNVWKKLVLLRPAWPVRVLLEEQVRLAAAGWDSMFRSPLSYFAVMTGRRLDETLLGDPIRLVDEHIDAMSKMGGLASDAGRHNRSDMVRVGGFVRLGVNDDGFTGAWANELIELSRDPVARHVHMYGASDETVQWFLNGGGAVHRERLMGLYPALDTPDGAADFLGVLSERIAHATRHDPELDELLRSRRLPGPGGTAKIEVNGRVRVEGFDHAGKVIEVHADGALVRHTTRDGNVIEAVYPLRELSPVAVPRDLLLASDDLGINPDFIAMLSRRVDANDSPKWMVGEDARFIEDQKAAARRASDVLFHALGSAPTNKLSRSPLFAQAYWKRALELSPYMDEASRATTLTRAGEVGVSAGDIRRARGQIQATPPGRVTLGHADDLAKAAALDDVKSLLFDMTERRQFFDVGRVLFPFGDAWLEVVSRWGRIVGEKPTVIRRLDQGLRTARSEGWFEEGAFGDEIFNYGPVGWAFENILGLPPGDHQGRVQGLNLMGEVYPGFGFAVQVPAAMIWGDNAEMQGLMEIVTPFGIAPTAQLTIMPPHMRRFLDGFLHEENWVPFLPQSVKDTLGNIGDFAGLTDPNRFERVRKDVMDHLIHNEGWPTRTQEDQDRLLAEAGRQTSLYLMAQGFSQAILPTVPIAQWKVETDVGLAHKAVVLDDWYTAQAEDPDGAVAAMLERYGDNAWILLQGKTRQVALNAPITATPLDWVRRNPHVVDSFPMVYGLFAPAPDEPEDIDPQAFDRVLRTGGRENLTGRQMLYLAQDRVGWSIYSSERSQFGQRLTPGEAAYMRDLEDFLLDEYPGWQRPMGLTERATPSELVREIQLAVKDPAIAATPAGQGVIEFLIGWDEAMAVGRELSSSEIPFASSQQTAHIRNYLRDVATFVIHDHPEFEPVWRMVFERTLIDPDEERP